MKKLRSLIYILLCAALCLALFPVMTFADSDEGGPVILEDSANEMVLDPSPAPARRMPLAAAPGGERSLVCSSFIGNSANRDYINRMIPQYLNHYPELTNALADGRSVVMFFEGGSDNVDSEQYKSSTDYRNGAVAVVIRNDENGHPYIADYCENCSTLPDFPHGYAYDNGHEGYGAATLLDGIYEMWTVNHQGMYAALNTRTNGMNSAPCVYMNEDGASFTIANGVGINVHARMRNTVGDSVESPVSSGCLTVGGNGSLTDYNQFLTAALNDLSIVKETTFNNAATYLYKDRAEQDAGNPTYPAKVMMVVDRYLARERMMSIYHNQEAVDLIISFSALSQADTANLLAGATSLYASFTDLASATSVYPSYADLTVAGGTNIKALPAGGADTVRAAGETETAIALYQINGEFWYRVMINGGVGFVKAESVSDVSLRYDDLSRHNVTWPTEKAYGNAFPVTGIFTSRYNRYSRFTAYLKDAAGSIKSTSAISGTLATYALDGADGAQAYADTLDNALAFSGLDKGDYRYQLYVTAKNYYIKDNALTVEEHTETIVDEPFTVVDIGFDPGTYSWKQGSGERLTIPSNVNFNRLNGEVSAEGLKLPVKIDGEVLERTYANYTFGLSDTNPVAVSLYPAALNAMDPGTHTITMMCTKGDIDATFRITCAEHQHTELRNVKKATTLSEGYSGDTYCADCGELLSQGHTTAKRSVPSDRSDTDKVQVVSAATADRGFTVLWEVIALTACIAAVIVLRKKRTA